MDPINVDFTGRGRDDGKKGVADVLIPPEHSGKKIAINIILTLILGAVLYYFMIPALNFKSIELYLFVVFVCLIYLLLTIISSRAFIKPEYLPYVKRRSRVPGILILALAAVALVGWLTGVTLFRAKSYSKLISVQDGDFAEDVAEIDFSSVPVLDSSSANKIAERTLGDLSDKVSQFVVSPYSTQINYKNTPVRVTALAYGDIFKWIKNTKEGLPAYIIVDMTTQEGQLVRLPEGMKYSPTEHFNKYLLRYLRFKYPTYLFDEPSFEIDESGSPYWIVPIVDKTIGLFGGTDIDGAIIVNAVTGECHMISTSNDGTTKLPTSSFASDPEWMWIDRIYSPTILTQQYNYYGKLNNGFINSVIGQEGVKVMSSGYNYLALNDDVYMYTGVTSISSDQSIIGFVLSDLRTKETKYYQVSREGDVKLENLTENALGKMYAMVNVKQSTIVGTGYNLTECTENYAAELKRNGVNVDIDVDEMGAKDDPTATAPETEEISGKITEIRSVVTGGETYFYLKLDAGSTFYKVPVALAEKVVILNVGDSVTVSVPKESSGDIVEVSSLK